MSGRQPVMKSGKSGASLNSYQDALERPASWEWDRKKNTAVRKSLANLASMPSWEDGVGFEPMIDLADRRHDGGGPQARDKPPKANIGRVWWVPYRGDLSTTSARRKFGATSICHLGKTEITTTIRGNAGDGQSEIIRFRICDHIILINRRSVPISLSPWGMIGSANFRDQQ